MKPFELLPLLFTAVVSALVAYNLSEFQHNVHDSKKAWLEVESLKLGGHDVNCQTIRTSWTQEVDISCTSKVLDEKAVEVISRMPNVVSKQTSMSSYMNSDTCILGRKMGKSCDYVTASYSTHTIDGDSIFLILIPKEIQKSDGIGYLTVSNRYNIWRGP